jgi:superfamily II DNA/RNA helicase
MTEHPEPSTPVRFRDMDEVHPHTAVALERAGLSTAFPIQAAVIPVASEGYDVLVKSPTGSGKTLAFGLPIIARIPRGERTPTAVILVPGRELAIQVRDELVPIAWSLQLRCVAVHGGGHGHKQAKQAAGAPIIVATPGRLVDLVRSRQVDLSRATMLVLDEADRMLDMGFTPQVEEVVRAMPRRAQTMLFSATLEGKVGAVAQRLTTDPQRIESAEVPGAGGEIQHVLVDTASHHKTDTLVELLADADRDLAVAFVRTQKGADNLTSTLLDAGVRATTIHGGMTQPERLGEYRRFQSGDCDVLVATDVFARGMDLDRITHVVNFELPEDADAYRHRIGRTGRAGRTGTAITLVTPKQRSAVEGLLIDLGLPTDLLKQMRTGATQRIAPAPTAARPASPRTADPARPRGARTPNRGRAAASDKPAFERDGNGRGAPLKRTAPPRGADPKTGGSGRGTITGYDPRKGFGFIKQAAGGKDVFFHRKAVHGADDRTLRAGMPVEFGLEPGSGSKLRAKRVTVSTRRR